MDQGDFPEGTAGWEEVLRAPAAHGVSTVGGGVVGDYFSGKLADSGISPQICEIPGFPLRRKVTISLLGAREASWMGAA